MGIKDLYKVIKENSVQPLEYEFSELKGLRIAVDISIFLYKTIRSVGNDSWMGVFIIFLCKLKEAGMKTICIFDGPNQPKEKKKEQERRREQNKKMQDRLKLCIKIRDNIQDNYITHEILPDKIIEEAKKVLPKRRKNTDVTNYYDPGDVVVSLNETIEKLKRQSIPITNEHRDKALEIVKSLGLKGIIADGEAETVCCYLVINEMADAVLTEDTDVLAYGATLFLALKDHKIHDKKFYGIHYPSLLNEMNFTSSQFKDLCILLGCDYNSRIKGFPQDKVNRKKAVGIGAKHALSMITKYKSIENLLKYIEDPEPLKYERCRKLLTIPKKIGGDFYFVNEEPNYEELKKILKKYRIPITIDYIKKQFSFIELDKK
jgi:flap endonuclease-1